MFVYVSAAERKVAIIAPILEDINATQTLTLTYRGRRKRAHANLNSVALCNLLNYREMLNVDVDVSSSEVSNTSHGHGRHET